MAGESLGDILEFAVTIAERAGKITLEHYLGQLEIERKSDATPVTIADRKAERMLREAIEGRFPNDGILGEEFGEARPDARRKWILDPIDGTYSFIHGVPLYGVLIGVEQDGEPVAGVVHIPRLGETVAGAKGEGCRWQGGVAQVSSAGTIGDALLLTTELNFDLVPERAGGLRNLVRAVGPARTWGDCYGYALVATGRADIMVDLVMHAWDCAALLPIIEEAGGRFTDWSGQRTIYGECAVATNGVLHDAVLELLNA